MTAPGRPSPIHDAETREQILRAVRAGNSRDAAAAQGGVHVSTLQRWLAIGRGVHTGDMPENAPTANLDVYREFYDRVKEAEGLAKSRMETLIAQAAATTWQAAAWWLERRFPGDYARTVKSEVTGRDGAPVRVQALGTERDETTDRIIRDPRLLELAESIALDSLEGDAGSDRGAPLPDA